MIRRPVHALALAAAFVILTAGECVPEDLGIALDKPGRIVVSNTGDDVAIVAISADDVKSYPTLAKGQTAAAATNVGGQYRVTVIMTPEATLEYRAELQALKRNVQALVDGTLPTEEKTRLFISLAGINASLAALDQGGAASCSGLIKLNAEDTETVNASVAWVRQSGSGFWNTNCGSN